MKEQGLIQNYKKKVLLLELLKYAITVPTMGQTRENKYLNPPKFVLFDEHITFLETLVAIATTCTLTTPKSPNMSQSKRRNTYSTTYRPYFEVTLDE